jgi:hypothetical protein
MKLISRSQSAFQGQNNTIVNEGDVFYIDGDTPEKDLSQRGREFLGSLRSGKQFFYPDTPEAEEFLAKIAEQKKLEAAKDVMKQRADKAAKRAQKDWWERPTGIVILATIATILAVIITDILFPHFFHSPKP